MEARREVDSITGFLLCGIKVIVTENSGDTEYQKDDYVYHDVFGTGKVLSVEKSIIKIAFKMPYGIKALMKNHKSLRKV